jgi:uncharacterized protein YjiS (DUF1127 family)
MEPHVSHYLDARIAAFDPPFLHLSRRRGQRRSGPGLLARLQAWQERRRAIRHLAQLDDRLLADIGLSRADIRPVVEDLITAEAANDNRPAAAA